MWSKTKRWLSSRDAMKAFARLLCVISCLCISPEAKMAEQTIDPNEQDVTLAVLTLGSVRESEPGLRRVDLYVLQPTAISGKLISFYLEEAKVASHTDWVLPGNFFTFEIQRLFLDDGSVLGLPRFEDLRSSKRIELGELLPRLPATDTTGLLRNHPELCELTGKIVAAKRDDAGGLAVTVQVLQSRAMNGEKVTITVSGKSAESPDWQRIGGVVQFFCLCPSGGQLTERRFALGQLYYVRLLPNEAAP
jgi:hypothetical protein